MDTESAVIYRRTKQGTWVVCGPVETVAPGVKVTVTTKSGKKIDEDVIDVGATFVKDGVQLRYGYVAQRPAKDAPTSPETPF